MPSKKFKVNGVDVHVSADWEAFEDGEWFFLSLIYNKDNPENQDDSIRCKESRILSSTSLWSQVREALEGQEIGSPDINDINLVRDFLMECYRNMPNSSAHDCYYGV